MKAAWLGNDLVTLFVAVPLLMGGLVLARRGSLRGWLVWCAMLGYCAYNYAYDLFGARINALFPVYIVLFTGPILALIALLGRAELSAIAADLAPRTPVRWIAGYMLLTGSGLLVAWITQWALFVFADVTPAVGEEAFTLVAALDLSLVVPFFLLGAALLWRRRPWGFVGAPRRSRYEYPGASGQTRSGSIKVAGTRGTRPRSRATSPRGSRAC